MGKKAKTQNEITGDAQFPVTRSNKDREGGRVSGRSDRRSYYHEKRKKSSLNQASFEYIHLPSLFKTSSRKRVTTEDVSDSFNASS